MRWSLQRPALGAVVALAFVASAVGPCHCLLDAASCHREAQAADAHACCEEPAGVQAVSDECCETSPSLVVASTDVPEVVPPTPQTGPVASLLSSERWTPVASVRPLPPLSLERTTVLLI